MTTHRSTEWRDRRGDVRVTCTACDRNWPCRAATEGVGREAVRTLEVVAEDFGFTLLDMCRPRGTRSVQWARQVGIYVLRETGDLSYSAIGRLVGGRDHTTAVHGVRRVRERMAENEGTRARVQGLVAQRTARDGTVDLRSEELAHASAAHFRFLVADGVPVPIAERMATAYQGALAAARRHLVALPGGEQW